MAPSAVMTPGAGEALSRVMGLSVEEERRAATGPSAVRAQRARRASLEQTS